VEGDGKGKRGRGVASVNLVVKRWQVRQRLVQQIPGGLGVLSCPVTESAQNKTKKACKGEGNTPILVRKLQTAPANAGWREEGGFVQYHFSEMGSRKIGKKGG